MSIVGFDYGTRNCTIAVIRKGKLDIATNEVSMRYTPNVVGFTFKKREVGEAGKVQFLRNANNSVYGPKFFLGRKYSDEIVKKNADKFGACRWTEVPGGDIGITANYAGNQTVLTAEQLVACTLVNLKKTTENYLEAPVSTCVLSCPGWWSHKQRKALLNSCAIADLIPLRVVNDLSAVAFNYGFYHPGMFDEKPGKMMFVSMGHYGFQCNIVEFSKPCCTVKGVAYDLSLGGYVLDEMLANHFADRFNAKHGCNIKENKRVMLKLFLAMEHVKKTLNTNPMAGVNQDCLYEGLDLHDKINKEEYFELLEKHNFCQRVVDCVKKCLADAKTDVSELLAIEWVGSGMRIQAVRDALTEFYGKPLSSTMNAEEATAQGCALLCARLSPTASTRPYDLVELNANTVGIHWRSVNDASDTKVNSAVLFPAGYALPSAKLRNSTFNRPHSKPFEIELKYDDTENIPVGCETIGICKIPSIPARQPNADGSVPDAEVRVKFRADPAGTFAFVQADSLEEREETVEVPIVEEKTEKKEGEAEKMETEEKPKTKKETKKVEVATKLNFEVVMDEIDAARLAQFKKFEQEMKATEESVVAALNAKNDLETFVYFVREKMDGAWKEHGTREEFRTLEDTCDQTSAWLYGEGDDLPKAEYDTKKAPLKALADKLALRHSEWTSVPVALKELEDVVNALRAEVTGGDEKYSHIAKEEMDKALSQIEEAEKVLAEAKAKWASVGPQQDPPVASLDLKMRKDNVSVNVTKILSTPKPAPPPPAKEETKMEEEKPQEQPAAEGATPMDTETN